MGRLLSRSLWDSRNPLAIPHHDERQSREYPHRSSSARPSWLGDWPRSGADEGISTLSRCHAGPTRTKMPFSCDLPLEREGFEPSVPQSEEAFETALSALAAFPSRQRHSVAGGAGGSNPASSAKESVSARRTPGEGSPRPAPCVTAQRTPMPSRRTSGRCSTPYWFFRSGSARE